MRESEATRRARSTACERLLALIDEFHPSEGNERLTIYSQLQRITADMQAATPSDEVAEAARALVAKLDECDKHISGAFFMAYGRMGASYTGPTYGEELETLRETLASLKDK
jgi:deoxyxylulose-5-phosphate synthase